MKVGFATTRLAKTCNDTSERVRNLGVERSEKVLRRLEQLDASENLADFQKLPQVRCHHLGTRGAEQFSTNLDDSCQLLFRAADDPIPRLPDGDINIALVTRVVVLEITETH